MDILFVCDANLAFGQFHSASWIEAIVSHISISYHLHVLTPRNDGAVKEETISLNKKTFAFYSVGLNDLFDFLSKKNFDLYVIFGTELSWSRLVVDTLLQLGKKSKTIVYAQGLSGACADHYFEGLPNYLFKKKTFRDLLRRENIAKQIRVLREREAKENQTLSQIDNFIGRTSLDLAILRKNNKECHYFHCNDILREEFYSGEWKYESCIKHSIFVSQYYYPLKGFHILLGAVSNLKKSYPDIKIFVSGYNPIAKEKSRDTSYIRYLRKLIHDYDLEDNIDFLGNLDAAKMKEYYLKSNLYVCPSTIENSPLSFAEALYLGLPCISSNVGGVSDMAEHRKEALLFPAADTNILSYDIAYLFDHPTEAIELGKRARKRALVDYDIPTNISVFEKVFDEVGKK